MVLNCFAQDWLENGIDMVITELTKDSDDMILRELREHWRGREMSSKYQELKEDIIDALTVKEYPDGVKRRSKVFIVSPSRKQGRTGNVLPRRLNGSNGYLEDRELDVINDSKLLTMVKRWVAEAGVMNPDDVLFIDGS